MNKEDLDKIKKRVEELQRNIDEGNLDAAKCLAKELRGIVDRYHTDWYPDAN